MNTKSIYVVVEDYGLTTRLISAYSSRETAEARLWELEDSKPNREYHYSISEVTLYDE